MKALSLNLLPTEILADLLLVRSDIIDDETYQQADTGIILSNLDDIIDMCQFAIDREYPNSADNFVHCKNCKYWTDDVDSSIGTTDKVKLCALGYYMVHETGYCVYGESNVTRE